MSLSQLSRRVWAAIFYDDLFTQSAALAYNFLLAVFPMLLFLVALFGIFASHRTDLQDHLFFYISQVLPPAAYSLVSKTFEEIIANSGGGKITLGLILALWVGAGGMSSLMNGLNAAYQIRDTRPFYKVRLIAIGLTLVSSFSIITALLIVLGGSRFVQAVGPALHLGWFAVMVWKALQWVAAVACLILAYALIYYFGPDLEEQHWYWITPGSIVGILLWLAVSGTLRVYLHFFNSYSKTYGSLGAVIVLLLWFYLTGFAFLIGAEINSEIEHAAARQGHPEAKPEAQKAA
jgi:membrane protein